MRRALLFRKQGRDASGGLIPETILALDGLVRFFQETGGARRRAFTSGNDARSLDGVVRFY
jgi:hypothetical protein